jgi:hypothetical protein
MDAPPTTLSRSRWIVLTASLVVGYMGWAAPQSQMPLDYNSMISRSIPCAILWGMVLIFSVWRYKKRGLWVLVGTPMALYWPIWLLFNQFPQCYYLHNCE